MKVVYAQQPFPLEWSKSIFLAGPTPRDEHTISWRPEALALLESAGFDGVVFVPEGEDENWRANYDDQIEWETRGLNYADVILFWVPREITVTTDHTGGYPRLSGMPAFTTNVEFGRWITSGKCTYGRPEWADKKGYLDWMFKAEMAASPETTLQAVVHASLDRFAPRDYPLSFLRRDGERSVPVHIWRTKEFQTWYAAQKAAGNRLEDGRVLWQHYSNNALFSWAFNAHLWIAGEKRTLRKEFVFSRPDVSTVVMYHRPADDQPRTMSEDIGYMGSISRLLDTEIVFIREPRVAAVSPDGYLHGLPSGSSRKTMPPLEIAAEEVHEETGLIIPTTRLVPLGARQLVGTLSIHQSHAFAVRLTAHEMAQAKLLAASRAPQGAAHEGERTYVEVVTVRDLIERTGSTDWSTLGTVLLASLSDLR